MYKSRFLLLLFVHLFITCQVTVQQNTFTSCEKNRLLLRDQLVTYINNIRAKDKKETLFYDTALHNIAMQRALDLAKKEQLSHIDQFGNSPIERMKRSGVYRTFVGENISSIYSHEQLSWYVINEWLKKDSERFNILSPRFNNVGMGFALKESNCIVVGLFSD